MPGPLQGIRVLDLTQYLAGPLCTQFLADFGAEIIKIEEPKGELGRTMPPLFNGESGCFWGVNRNKKSLSLNLRQPEGKDIFCELVKIADVVIEQFRPGVMRKLGLDYESLKAINERIVFCSLSSYGQTGPLAQEPAHDVNFLSLSGISDLTGAYQGPPVISTAQSGAIAGGSLYAISAILMALLNREKTGVGQYCDVAMLDGALTLLTYNLGVSFGWGRPSERGNDSFTGGYAFYNIYPTADGRYLTLAALETRFWEHFCLTIERPQYIPDQWTTGKQRAMIDDIASIMKTRSAEEWLRIFEEMNPCLTPVLTVEEMANHPQVQAREMMHRLPNFLNSGRDLLIPGVPIKLSDTPGHAELTFPAIGEHNNEIMGYLGYTPEQIERLRENGIL